MKYLLVGLALVVSVVALRGAAKSAPGLELRLVSAKETQLPGEQGDLHAVLVNNGKTPVYFEPYLMDSSMQIQIDGEWIDCRPVFSILNGVADNLKWQRVDPGKETTVDLRSLGQRCLGNDSVHDRDWSEVPGDYRLRVAASHRLLDSHEVARLGPAPEGARVWTLTSNVVAVSVEEPTGIDAEALRWAREQGHDPIFVEVANRFPESRYAALYIWRLMTIARTKPAEINSAIEKGFYPGRYEVPDAVSPDGTRLVECGQEMARWRIEQGSRLLREQQGFPYVRDVQLSIAVSYAVIGDHEKASELLKALANDEETPEGRWAGKFLAQQSWLSE